MCDGGAASVVVHQLVEVLDQLRHSLGIREGADDVPRRALGGGVGDIEIECGLHTICVCVCVGGNVVKDCS